MESIALDTNCLIEYELIGIDFCLEYEIPVQSHTFVCEETNTQEKRSIPSITFDDAGIPMGTTVEEVKMRQKIIFQFYENWKNAHVEKAVYNKNLKTEILIRKESVVEAAAHASKRYKSTLAVLRLDDVLANAEMVDTDIPKQGNKNQMKLVKMILMSYTIADIGIIKLTVGVRRRSLEKIQYGITALEHGEIITPASKGKKKKASHKK